jgi:imidazolonepropionase-like amidohydrolase
MVWREIRLLHDHGATPMAAIQAATSSAARCWVSIDEVGTVESGKWADLSSSTAIRWPI